MRAISPNGRNWTRTSDPHDVNVEVWVVKSLAVKAFQEIHEGLSTQFIPNQVFIFLKVFGVGFLWAESYTELEVFHH